MIAKDHDLPIKRQAELLAISRSAVYYRARPVRPDTLALMRRIDELHLELPFAGSRMLRDLMRLEGACHGRHRIRRLMRIMGIEAIYRKKNTSVRHAQHPVYPYLLRNLVIDRPNQVWATDITFVPMARGFVYLVAVIDWATRKILSWRISNTLTSDFCVEALQEALNRYGTPEIFNTDQGSQFTSLAFTSVLKAHGIRISMDGRGCWRDNVFVERLWKSIKYEEIYLHAYEGVSDVRNGLARYIAFYNQRRPHTANGRVPPDYRYYEQLPQSAAA
jgi:putative transposase